MSLAHITIGEGRPVAFVHGFTQTGRTWLPVIESLGVEISATLIDAPGHGASTNGKRTLIETASDIRDVMAPGFLVGYSMGARMALHTALMAPERVTALVLISGTAGIENESERASRRANDLALSQRIMHIGVDAFIDEWLDLPMFQGLSREAANIPERVRNTAQGLADSLNFAGTGTQEPLWEELHKLHMPVLIVAGVDDAKFVDAAVRMSEKITHSTLCVVPNAGHTVHLEQPNQFNELFEAFLTSNAEIQAD